MVTDPPYKQTSLKWDKPVRGWLDLVRPMLARWGSVWSFGSLAMFLDLAARGELAQWRQAQDIVWEKQNGAGFQNDRFKRVHELAVHLYPREVPWSAIHREVITTPDAVARTVRRKKRPAHMGDIDGHVFVAVEGGPRLMRSVLRVRNEHGRAVHPTQKPLGIVEPLIRFSVPPGELVIDPFAGSGTTLVAAKLLGRRAIGIEASEADCEKAARRLDEVLWFGAELARAAP